MQGKLQVVSTILKMNRPFRPPHIMEETGLDRQLVYYHLRTLTESGLIRKYGKTYEIEDRESLLNSLVEIAEHTDTKLMHYERKLLLSKPDCTKLNVLAESIVCARALHEDIVSVQAKDALLDSIDLTVRQLKTLRKFLVSAQRTQASAAKKIGNDLEECWTLWMSELDFQPEITFKEWSDRIEGTVANG